MFMVLKTFSELAVGTPRIEALALPWLYPKHTSSARCFVTRYSIPFFMRSGEQVYAASVAVGRDEGDTEG